MPRLSFGSSFLYGIFVEFPYTARKAMSCGTLRRLFHKKAATIKSVSVGTRLVQIVFHADILIVTTPLVVFLRDSKPEL